MLDLSPVVPTGPAGRNTATDPSHTGVPGRPPQEDSGFMARTNPDYFIGRRMQARGALPQMPEPLRDFIGVMGTSTTRQLPPNAEVRSSMALRRCDVFCPTCDVTRGPGLPISKRHRSCAGRARPKSTWRLARGQNETLSAALVILAGLTQPGRDTLLVYSATVSTAA